MAARLVLKCQIQKLHLSSAQISNDDLKSGRSQALIVIRHFWCPYAATPNIHLNLTPQPLYVNVNFDYKVRGANMRLWRVFSFFICSAFLSSTAIAHPSAMPSKSSDISYLSELLGGLSGLGPTREDAYPRTKLLQTAQEACCPAGYPWYRQSTNTCFSSYDDCHNSNGGGWSCRQVNAC